MSPRAVACKELAVLLTVLSHPHRLRIALELQEGERDVGGLQEALGTSHSAVSQHLSVLEVAGLVTSQKKGQYVHYSLAPDQLTNTLNGYVQEVCPVARPLKRESAALAKAKAAGPDDKPL